MLCMHPYGQVMCMFESVCTQCVCLWVHHKHAHILVKFPCNYLAASVDQLLSESLNTLDLTKKGSPKSQRFKHSSSFHTHTFQTTSQQSTFAASSKVRNWSNTDELSGVFSEADEFTEFEAAPFEGTAHRPHGR